MSIKSTVAGILIAAALGQSAGAAEHGTAFTQKDIGVGSGVVVGALAAGPLGAIAGAWVGGWLGDRYAKSEYKRVELERAVNVQTSENAELTTRLAAADRLESEHAEDRDRYERLVADLHRLESDVPFKTNEAVLSAAAEERLRVLGTMLAGLPQAKVRVSGFADPRGTKQQNLALSRRRANTVVMVLSQAGVRSDQLIVDARGADDAPADALSLDDFALERRATVRLEPPSGSAISAQN